MPKYLLERLRPDSIGEFRGAARQRFDDGLITEAEGRPTAAIYLWGYSAEMILKAAYFDAVGFEKDQPILRSDLNVAVRFGTDSGVFWPRQGQLHNLRSWAETLVVRRGLSPNASYTTRPGFGVEVAKQGQTLERIWSERLRYHKNIAYRHEVRRARNAVEWLMIHSSLL